MLLGTVFLRLSVHCALHKADRKCVVAACLLAEKQSCGSWHQVVQETRHLRSMMSAPFATCAPYSASNPDCTSSFAIKMLGTPHVNCDIGSLVCTISLCLHRHHLYMQPADACPSTCTKYAAAWQTMYQGTRCSHEVSACCVQAFCPASIKAL